MQLQAGLLGREAALWFGGRPALTAVRGSETVASYTFGELNEAANRIGSGLLELGVRRGDRVGVLAHNVPEVVEAWLGLEKHNLVRTTLHSHFDADVHVATLNEIRASALLFDTRFSGAIAAVRNRLTTTKHLIAIGPDVPDWAVAYADVAALGHANEAELDVDEDALCFLQPTSGTTGRPKLWTASYRSWHAFVSHNLHHLDTFGPDTPPVRSDDVNLHFHALQWASGAQTLYPYLIRGARSVLLDDADFDPAVVVDTMLREGVTATLAPAPLWGPVLDVIESRGGIDHRLRRVVVLFCDPQILDRTTRLLGAVWAHGFGSTEQGASATRLLPSDLAGHPDRIGSVGRPGSPFFEISIKDPVGNSLGLNQTGEICVRSAMSLGQYWEQPETTAAARFPGGWFRSDDVGYLDADGFLYYSDRAGDTIITPGGAVYPHLVEAALASHPAVRLSGVVGDSADSCPSITAFIQLKEGRSPSEHLAQEILATARGTLAEHELPARIEFVAELPTVLGGAKVQRAALRSQLAGIDDDANRGRA
ncbi:MAG TPA: class I adenylate-forming enzyme family protein [Mycobacterium sp.]|nr:class I adenylate-forming enzyme family protein [Mycobacterium sp.]